MSKNKIAATLLAGTTAISLAACSSSGESEGGLLGAIESGNVILGVKFDQPGIGLVKSDGVVFLPFVETSSVMASGTGTCLVL